MTFFKDFKAFAIKGNVIDLAVAVIIGGAFNKIVTSLVNDIIMPPIGIFIGGVDFTALKFVLQKATEESDAVVISYGMFIQNVVNFIIIAFSVFIIVRVYRSMERKEEKAPPAPSPVAPSNQEKLLAEIRDLLKDRPTKE